VQSYERQARRWRLVQSHAFSPGFVNKQKQALDKEQAHLEQVTRRMVQSVPRVTESKLLRAFVWPESPVRVQRVVDNLKAVQVVDNSLQWKLNQKGLELRPAGNRLQLEATFETTIKNPAVLQAFKRSIETVWNGPVRIKGGTSKQLRTKVKFHRVSSESQFSEGSLRLVEGAKNCANQNVIHLARSFSGVTPAHEFGHILGLRDTYKTLYDPRGRAFVEVQDRTTLMGSHKAPATCNTMTRACNNLLQR
jgi:hypothetical protein